MARPTYAGSGTGWRAAQLAALAVLAAAALGLLLDGRRTLAILWNGVIPLVPASLAITPALWRNVCPLATLSVAAARTTPHRPLLGAAAVRAEWTGILLLGALIPARHLWFNQSPAATLGLVVTVLGAAAVFGSRRDLKAGFCNAFCPLLPVERLYGQAPLVVVGNPRCAPCTVCTPRGCPDLARAKVTAQLLGPARRTATWLHTPFGAFAAGFPGLVAAYFLTGNAPEWRWAAIYGAAFAGAAASWLVVSALVRTLRPPALATMRALGITALMLYYWWAAPAMATLIGVPGVVWLIRGAAAVLALMMASHTQGTGRRHKGEEQAGNR